MTMAATHDWRAEYQQAVRDSVQGRHEQAALKIQAALRVLYAHDFSRDADEAAWTAARLRIDLAAELVFVEVRIDSPHRLVLVLREAQDMLEIAESGGDEAAKASAHMIDELIAAW